MSDTVITIPLDRRQSFECWASEKIRFGDTDKLGHVNNAVFTIFSETGRIAYMHDPALPPLDPGTSWVIVRIELDYRAEVLWPAIVDIGTVLLHVGRSSARIGQGMFLGENCVSTAINVLAVMDLSTRRSSPLPKALGSVLRGRLGAG